MAKLSPLQRFWMNAWPHRIRLYWRVPQFLRACPTPFRGEVLEVGAGRGWTSRRILETFPQVELTAVDVDPDVATTFQRLQMTYGNRLHVQQADVTKLPFDREQFDFVVAINVLRHLRGEERALALTELLRVLRPGGLVGLSETGGEVWEEVKRRLSEEDCEVLYVSAKQGFTIWARKEHGAHNPLTTGAT